MFLNRRRLLSTTVAAGSALVASMKAHAKFSGDVELRGQIGRLERLPTRDLESMEDFRTSLRAFINRDFQQAANRRAEAILAANGIPRDADLPWSQVVALMENDPIIMNQTHAWITNQLAMWRDLQDAFHGDADRYLSEMAAADKAGPGSLELNPDMHIPPYTAWEIHNQPGGYVGDPFAGHMYHYGTNNLWLHDNDQDRRHAGQAAATPVPDDGKVRRILDIGCSAGQMAITLKERFPDAEVWGLDIGGPMVRYAHMRAVDLGVDVNFAQRLAEDTKFPDNHFDIVTAFILFHEVSPEATPKIISEVFRVLRPGGKFFALDGSFQVPRPKPTAYAKYRAWWTDQWNSEVWYIPFFEHDYQKTYKQVGFEIGTTAAPPLYGNAKYMVGIKPA
jgi:ubiquinone/menaquinone biosynthesis C-methylase UbiE